MRTVQWYLKKLKIKFPHDPEIPLPAIYTKELKAATQTDIRIFVFIAAKPWTQLGFSCVDE